MVEIYLIGNAHPNGLGGIWLLYRHAIYTSENIARIYKILNKGNTEFIKTLIEIIKDSYILRGKIPKANKIPGTGPAFVKRPVSAQAKI